MVGVLIEAIIHNSIEAWNNIIQDEQRDLKVTILFIIWAYWRWFLWEVFVAIK